MVVVVAVWLTWLYGLSNEAFSQPLRRKGGRGGGVMWSSGQRLGSYVVEVVGTTYIRQ